MADFPADFRQAPIINGTGATAYPIAAYTYLLAYLDQKDADKGKAFVAFSCWALTDGQADRARPRLRAAARRGPAEGHRRAPHVHHRRLADLALIQLSSSSGAGRGARTATGALHLPLRAAGGA